MNPAPSRRLCAAVALGLLAGTVLPGRENSAVRPVSTQGMLLIPEGNYTPLSVGPKDPGVQRVAAFFLDEYPVTNAEFLAFVQANPRWRRSQVSPLFADSSYLQDWRGDLEPGPACPPDSPVVHVSWFAARAYAHSAGKRLPTTAEWELAASAGYTRRDGRHDPELNRDLFAWFARPAPAVLPAVTTTRANFFGVHGLHGLVWEWVEDFNGAVLTGLDPNLTCAGGAADVKDTGNYAAFMRQAMRSSLKANNTTGSLGFRCARDAGPATASLP